MKPVSFPEQNKIYTAPTDWDESKHGPCGDLPVRQENGAITSCYELDEQDLAQLLMGARLYFTIWTDRQPVVSWGIR